MTDGDILIVVVLLLLAYKTEVGQVAHKVRKRLYRRLKK